MATKTVKTTTDSPTAPEPRPRGLGSIQFGVDSAAGRLARTPYLQDILSADPEVSAALAAYSIAQRTAFAAERLALSAADPSLSEDVLGAMLSGEDPETLLAMVHDRTVAAGRFTAGAQTVRRLADGLLYPVSTAVEAAGLGLTATLAERLAALLETGRDALADLGIVRDADAAIDAGCTAAWAALRSVHISYIELREAHNALLRADRMSFNNGDDQVVFAYFLHPETVFPAIGAVAARTRHTAVHGLDVRGIAGSPVDLGDPRSFDHLLLAIEQAESVGTAVLTAAEAQAARSTAVRAAQDDEEGRTLLSEPSAQESRVLGQRYGR